VASSISSSENSSAIHFADRTRHRIALRLLPFLFFLYVTNYLDRTSVAYAAIGMSRELGFTDRVFGLAAGVFFVGYVALQIPGAILVERWSARRVLSATMIAWGSLTAFTAFVHTPAQLYVARFVLGAAEAGFFPGVVIYLSHWFLRKDRAKATSNFMAAIPISFVIGSPIAGWLLSRQWLDVQGWRWLFLLEGLPAVILGIVAFFYLPDYPAEARWLSAAQRQWTEESLRAEKVTAQQKISVWQAICSKTIVLLAAVAFLYYFAFYTFVFWFPTMLKRLSGYSDMNVGWLGALPYLSLFFAMQINGWHSDRTRERRWHTIVPGLLGAVGSLGLLMQTHSVLLAMLFFILLGVADSYLPVFWAIPTEILGESAAAAAVGLINSIGSIAGFAGPFLFGYLNTRTGSYSAGLMVMTAALLAGTILMLFTPRNARACPA
jgi:ACS family tartrate transporter-like MFS transporter